MKYKTSAIAAAICLALTPTAFAGGDKTAPKAAGSSAQSTSSMSSSANAETIRQVQQKLMDQGQNPGPIDGIMGPQTKAAVKSYQETKGMTASGNLDRQTMTALGVDGSASASGSTGSSPMGSSSTGSASDSSSTGSTPSDGTTTPPSGSTSGSPSGSNTTGTTGSGSSTTDPTKPRN